MKKELIFADRMTYDPNLKTAVSIRDGILEYYGSEIGMEPAEKIFMVYRSPATIANAAALMSGIPVTDEHVSLDESAPVEGGNVESSEMFDMVEELTHTTIATKNKLAISDALRVSVESGKRELSLGYRANLEPHEQYDFEQKNITPHHLAIVSDGRCGSMCSFIDRKPTQKDDPAMKKTKLHKAFTDEAGAMNLQQIAEIVASFPEAIQQMPLDKVQSLVPTLVDAMTAAKEVGAEVPAEELEDEAGEEEKDIEDANADKGDEKEKDSNFSDSADFKDAVKAAAVKLTDAAIKRHSEVIEKAKTFVDEQYSFADKSTDEIMRDAVATQSEAEFSDAELPTAFKLLKNAGDYKTFGDTSGADKFSKLADKEL